MGFGGASRLGEILKSSYKWTSHKGMGPFYVEGVDPPEEGWVGWNGSKMGQGKVSYFM